MVQIPRAKPVNGRTMLVLVGLAAEERRPRRAAGWCRGLSGTGMLEGHGCLGVAAMRWMLKSGRYAAVEAVVGVGSVCAVRVPQHLARVDMSFERRKESASRPWAEQHPSLTALGWVRAEPDRLLP